MHRGALPGTFFALLLSMLPSVGAAQSEVGAGARAEVKAGQSPRSAVGDSDRALIGELRLGVGVRRSGHRSETTLRYLPRLWYRPQTVVPERPLIYHQLTLAHQSELGRQSRLNLALDSALGELAYSTLIDDAIGRTHGGFETRTFSLFSLTASAAWEQSLSRVTRIILAPSGGYRAPTTLPVAPGIEVSGDESPIPRSAEASLATLLAHRASRRLELSFPLTVSYFWSDVVGSLGAISAEGGVTYALTRLTELQAALGATYIVVPDSASLASVPAFPAARLGLTSTLRRSEAREWSASVTGQHSGYFDTLQGDYRPAASLVLSTQYRYGDWSISAAAQLSTITAEELKSNEARSNFRLDVPVTVRLSHNLELAFGGQASARARDFPPGPLELEQVELLGFVALSVVAGTGEGARWML
jgi:hypothetical protein